MSEKRFEVVLNEFDEVEYIIDKKLCEDRDFAEFMDFVERLAEENKQLRQKIKHCVYVDVDNEKGCMNCKYDIGSICSILNCGTHDYLKGVSEQKCGLKYWECKDE